MRRLGVVVTFHVVTLLWILFRAPDLATAGRVFRGPFTQPLGDLGGFVLANAYALALYALFAAWHRFDTHARLRWAGRKLNPAMLWPATALVWIVAITVSTGSSAKFIYFDF
jgi:alginate O-acetyltransferase complex protein AlgI